MTVSSDLSLGGMGARRLRRTGGCTLDLDNAEEDTQVLLLRHGICLEKDLDVLHICGEGLNLLVEWAYCISPNRGLGLYFFPGSLTWPLSEPGFY